MFDPAFTAQHGCDADACRGEQVLHCDAAGVYGAYALPFITQSDALDGSGGVELSVPFLLSTWDPYNVALFVTRVSM